MTDKLHRGEPADASGLPFGTENPANTTVPEDADAPARAERDKQTSGDDDTPSELERRSVYERGPQ